MSAQAPSRGAGTRGELATCAVLLGVWLFIWAALTAAAALAGGEPRATPWAFADPARIAGHIRADGGLVLWHLVDANAHVTQWRFWLLLSVTPVAGLGAMTLLCLRMRLFTKTPSFTGSRIMDASRWAHRRDLRDLRVRRGREEAFVLGSRGRRLIVTQAETSVLVIGPTRSGKTSALVVPNLLTWPGPAVVTSTKDELLDVTAAQRQRIGPVYVYDPTGELDSKYARMQWSPLTGCGDLDHAWRVASWLCSGLQQGSSRGDNDWAHWTESGKLLIAPLLYAASRSRQSILDVQSWLHAFDLSTAMSLLEEMMLDEATHSNAERALTMLAAVDQRPERERGTVFSTVMRTFSALNESRVAESARWNRFDADELLRSNGTLYLCTPRQVPERVAPLFIGLLMSVVTAAYTIADAAADGRLPSALGLFLDELANVVPIEDLPGLASQGAGRGVVLMSIVQDLSQLRSRYGADKTNSILNNHTCKVILPGLSDPETTDLVAKLAGQRAHNEVQVTHAPDGKRTTSYTRRLAPLATPDMLRQLPHRLALVLYKGRPPALVRIRPWHRDRNLRKLASQRYVRHAEHVLAAKDSAARGRRRDRPAA